MSFTWDLNVTTMLGGILAVIVFYVGILRQQDKLGALEDRMKTTELDLAAKNSAINALSQAFSTFRDTLNKELRDYSSWEGMKELEERLSKNSLLMENRFNNYMKGMEERLVRQIGDLTRRIEDSHK